MYPSHKQTPPALGFDQGPHAGFADNLSRLRPARLPQTTNCQRRPWAGKEAPTATTPAPTAGARNTSRRGARRTTAETKGQYRKHHSHEADDETTGRRGWKHGGTAAVVTAAARAAPTGRQRLAPRPPRRRKKQRKWRRRGRPGALATAEGATDSAAVCPLAGVSASRPLLHLGPLQKTAEQNNMM